jgi:hypothetical protein
MNVKFVSFADLDLPPDEYDDLFSGRKMGKPYLYVCLAWKPKTFSLSSDTALYAKFGIANDPLSRIEGFRTGNPLYIDLWEVCYGGYELEKKIHNFLRSEKAEGEWFFMTEKVIQVVRHMPEDDPIYFAK